MDEILKILEKRRMEPAYKKFFRKPLAVISEKPVRLTYISTVIAIAIFLIAFFSGMAGLADALITAFFAAIIPPGLYDHYEKEKIRKIDSEFPNLLRDIALSRKAGMTVQAAVDLAAMGEYGKLTAGLRWMNTLSAFGVPFPEVLRFTQQHPTPLIKRAISIIIEADRIGGEIGDILETVANDVQATLELEEKRRSEAMPYVGLGYLAFFVFLAIILALYTQFLPMMVHAARAVGEGEFAGATIAVTEVDIERYRTLFFHALLIQGFCTGIVTGKISTGRAVSGLRHSVVFIVVSYVAYGFISSFVVL